MKIFFPPAPQRAPFAAAAEQGFTLLELLVVLTILGMLVYFVAPAALRQLGSAKHKIAQQSIERLVSVLEIYKLDVGHFPSTDEGLQALITAPAGTTNWNGPYLKTQKLPLDPWDRPFIYRNPATQPQHDFDLCSLGSDGQPGGTGEAADLCN